jgi:two-component system cell cycle sensor histidine kinase/response regulator CckA
MDDEEVIRTFMGKGLTRLGYKVETCTEGNEAITKYQKAKKTKNPFDVVILDLTNNFGMGGQETMKKLLKIDHNVKGIALTGFINDPVVTNHSVYGFSGILTKPVTKSSLSKVINDVMGKDN